MPQHEHPNVVKVRQGFEAFTTGDVGWLNENLADDVVWHVGRKSKMTGVYRGKEEVLNLYARQGQLSGGGPPRLDLHEVLGNDEHVIRDIDSSSATLSGRV